MSGAANTSQEQDKQEATLLSTMVKSSFDFWQTVMQEMAGSGEGESGAQTGFKSGSLRPYTARSLQEMFEAMQGAMVESGLTDNLTQGMNRAPEMVMKLTQAWTEDVTKIVQEGMNGMSRSFSEHSEQRPDSSLQALLESYSQSMHKMLNMPKLGINRYYQERMSQAMDKLNLFTAVASEFSLLMLQPVESSLVKMQNKVKEMAEGDGYFEDAKEYYSMWIKFLEGDYMNLLQSQEFIKIFHDVVNRYLEFYSLYEEVMQDGLQFLPVTTKNDMEAVYKENYLLKKEVKSMSRRMKELEKKVEGLEGSGKK